MADDSRRTDAILLLYDLAGSKADTLFRQGIDRAKQATRRDGGIHIASIPLSDFKRGIVVRKLPAEIHPFQGAVISRAVSGFNDS